MKNNPYLPMRSSPGGNAFAPIDIQYQIDLERAMDMVKYSIKGTHDGFPSYSIFIGDKLAYFHDALVWRTSLFNLLPPMERDTRDNCGSCRGNINLAQTFSPIP